MSAGRGPWRRHKRANRGRVDEMLCDVLPTTMRLPPPPREQRPPQPREGISHIADVQFMGARAPEGIRRRSRMAEFSRVSGRHGSKAKSAAPPCQNQSSGRIRARELHMVGAPAATPRSALASA